MTGHRGDPDLSTYRTLPRRNPHAIMDTDDRITRYDCRACGRPLTPVVTRVIVDGYWQERVHYRHVRGL